MCGINGGWIEGGVEPTVIEASLDAMKHRGPDESGFLTDAPVFLGNRRLSIIDLDTGRQPIFNEDRSIAAVLNGEIYNYLELAADLESRGHRFSTRSDTETLVHLYERFGSAMCERLRGMFAFVLWDSRKRILFAARDRFGKKPLYYSRLPGRGIIFASEIKGLRPLAAGLGERWAVNEQAVYDYLSLAAIPQPETIYKEVLSVPPASWMSFDGRDIRRETYWRIGSRPKRGPSRAELLERTRELTAEAVRLRLRSDVPLGVFLSGGMDSSVVAFEAARELGGSLQTFTIASEDEAYDESPVARRTAKFLGVENISLPLKVSPLDELRRIVGHYDQPYADSSAIPSFSVARLAREHVKVILNGDGGDELFGGYRRHHAALRRRWFNWVPSHSAAAAANLCGRASTGRRSIAGFAQRFFRGLALDGGALFLAWTTDMLTESDKMKLWKGSKLRATEEWIEDRLPTGVSALDVQMKGDMEIHLLSDLLVKMDIATMAASLEGRSPLLDHELAEFAFSVPASDLLRCGTTKSLLRDAYRDRLPEEVITGAKRGFEIPLGSWLAGDLRPLLTDTVGAPSARVRSYLDGSFIDDLLAQRVMQDRNRPYIVYSLLVLELWLREYESGTLP